MSRHPLDVEGFTTTHNLRSAVALESPARLEMGRFVSFFGSPTEAAPMALCEPLATHPRADVVEPPATGATFGQRVWERTMLRWKRLPSALNC